MKMFAMKSKILQASLGLAAALPLTTAGAFTFANSAEAATFSGGFNYTPTGVPLPSVVVSNNSLKFSPTSPANLILSEQTGTFGPAYPDNPAFDIATIYDVSSPLFANTLFLDLGKYNDSSNTTSDQKNIFVLESLENPILSNNNGVTGVMNFTGYFTDVIGSLNKTTGKGHLNFSVASNINFNNAKTLLEQGKLTASFTGVAFTTVPEPAALLGLGLTGAVMFVSRRRKGQAAS